MTVHHRRTFSSNVICAAALCVLTLAILACIEMQHPYYFLQDDNRGQFLPDMVHCYRAVMGGEFPFFNFHQHLGIPVSLQYASLYPFIYVALFLSKAVLGNFFGTMEILAALHLLIAVTGFFRLARFFELDEFSSSFGALAWTFAGFVMIVGNSWWYVVGYAAYTPWLFLLTLRLGSERGLRSFVMLTVVNLLALLQGNPQYFAYLVLFNFVSGCAVIATRIPIGAGEGEADVRPASRPGLTRFVVRYAVNYAVTAVLALPVLLPALHQVRISAERSQPFTLDAFAAYGYDLTQWLSGLVTPFLHPAHYLLGEQHAASHIGYLTAAFTVMAIVASRRAGMSRQVTIFMALAATALLWSADILLLRLMYYVPIYNRLRMPFKLEFFTSFYLILVATFGAAAFRRSIDGVRVAGKRIAPCLLTIVFVFHVVNFVVLYALLPQQMLSVHADTVPYDEPLKEKLVDGRIVSVGLDVERDGDKTLWGNSVPSIGFNYASMWGLYHFGGNDALVPLKNFTTTLGCNWRSDFNVAPGTSLRLAAEAPLEHFRKWGVRWYVVDGRIPLQDTGSLVPTFHDRYRRVLYDPEALSYVFWADSLKNTGTRYVFTTNTMKIETQRASDGVLTVNVLHNPYFIALLDGRDTGIVETSDGQMSVNVPQGRHEVVLTYVDRDFIRGCIISSAALVVFLFGYLIMRMKRFRQSDG